MIQTALAHTAQSALLGMFIQIVKTCAEVTTLLSQDRYIDLSYHAGAMRSCARSR
jgi:hypothetical protein